MTFTPSKCVLRMKFTTPATASAPYTAEAPPVSTSTRSISAAGIWLMSEKLRPPTAEPGPRRLTVDEHQGALRTQAAQVNGRRAVRAVGGGRVHAREHHGQIVEHVLDARQTGLLQVDRRHGRDRADRGLVWSLTGASR